MKKLVHILDEFFFGKISATGMGMMRAAWGGATMAFMLSQWNQVTDYYSNAGFLPNDLQSIVTRTDHRFTIFEWVTEPHAVFTLYLLYILVTACVLVGVFPRISTIVSALLLFSFHERNSLILAGGETVLRNVGYILMFAPGTSAFSLHRADLQWRNWVKNGKLLPPLQVSAWGYRLILWQCILMYVYGGVDKLFGTMWWQDGTAVAVAIHHGTFGRDLGFLNDWMSNWSPLLGRLTVIFEIGWVLLLIPKPVWQRLGFAKNGGVKRVLMFWGVVFHFWIWVLMKVGTFPVAVGVAYLGLLKDEDFEAMRARCNRFWKTKMVVLYDGRCGLCRRSMAWLEMMDWLHRLKFADFRDVESREKFAEGTPLKDLDRALHVRFSGKDSRKGEMKNGFDAIRALSWHLPAIWFAAPFLYLPGVAPIGRFAYQFVADRRNRCTDESCLLA